MGAVGLLCGNMLQVIPSEIVFHAIQASTARERKVQYFTDKCSSDQDYVKCDISHPDIKIKKTQDFPTDWKSPDEPFCPKLLFCSALRSDSQLFQTQNTHCLL